MFRFVLKNKSIILWIFHICTMPKHIWFLSYLITERHLVLLREENLFSKCTIGFRQISQHDQERDSIKNVSGVRSYFKKWVVRHPVVITCPSKNMDVYVWGRDWNRQRMYKARYLLINVFPGTESSCGTSPMRTGFWLDASLDPVINTRSWPVPEVHTNRHYNT